jgi:hypothetical protein
VTLDADVAAEIERIRKLEGRRFKHVLNDVLRAGLRELSGRGPAGGGPATHPRDLGEARFDVSNTSRAIAHAEGEDHR